MVKKNNEKKLEGVSKTRQNQIAVDMSVRDDEHIYYDYKNPLVVNSELKITEIFVVKDEEVDNLIELEDEDTEEVFGLESRFDTQKRVRIVFRDECPKYLENRSSADKTPYMIDITVAESLEEVEQRIMQCDDESDIEDIEDEL